MAHVQSAMLLTTALLTLATASVDAATDRVLAKGIRLGLVRADMTGADTDPDLTARTGLTAGAFVTMPLTAAVAVQPEILFTQKGGEIETGTSPYELDFSYVEAPLLCKVTMVGRDAPFRPSLYGGPFVALKISAQTETYSDRNEEESVEEGLAHARQVDAGFVLGVGIDQVLGPGRVLLDVRYGGSLLSAVTTGAKSRHSVVSFLVGYSFD